MASIYVTIRGTNIYLGEDIWGILLQIWQDIDGTSQVPLPWLPTSSPVRIAQGTMDGLHHIKGLTIAKGVSLGDYLTKTLGTPAYSNIKTVVTGHSLGGCLATVVAPWIELIQPVSYKGTIQPITFAAPTFTTARRFQNTLDIIPLAFQDLLDVGFIYRSYGLDTPDIVWTGITGMEFWLLYYNMTYMQPAAGTQELTGNFLEVPEWDWYDEALFQHHPATYRGLLLGQPLLESSLPHSTVTLGTEARLANRIGSLDALKRAVRPGAAG